MMRSGTSRGPSATGQNALWARLPRNLGPALIFAAVYLGAMALVIAPRHVLGDRMGLAAPVFSAADGTGSTMLRGADAAY